MVIKLTFGNLDVTEATDALLNGIKSSIAEAARVPVGWVDVFDVVAGSTVVSFRVHFDAEDVEAKNNFEALVSADAPAIFKDDPALAGLGVEKQVGSPVLPTRLSFCCLALLLGVPVETSALSACDGRRCKRSCWDPPQPRAFAAYPPRNLKLRKLSCSALLSFREWWNRRTDLLPTTMVLW